MAHFVVGEQSRAHSCAITFCHNFRCDLHTKFLRFNVQMVEKMLVCSLEQFFSLASVISGMNLYNFEMQANEL